ncbi:MAG: hypothetical protein K2J47_04305 [Ruminococcus sp.]|nr:hypothetical protein [Ruminococcus sp.]
MKKLSAFALSVMLAMGLVSCSESKVKITFDYVKDKGAVVWDTGYLTVTFEDYDASNPLAPIVKLKAENKSDKHTSLFADDLYVNDRFMTVLAAKGIEAGETSELELSVFDGAAENAGIDEIGQVSFRLISSDPESIDLNNLYKYSDEIIISTDKTDWKENQKIPDSELLYDKKGLQISALLDDKNYMEGYVLPLYINNNREDATVCLSKMRIDGKETDISDVNVLSLKKGKDAVKFMTIYPAYEGIDEYSKTEVQFTFTLDSTGDVLITDYITIQGLTGKEN